MAVSFSWRNSVRETVRISAHRDESHVRGMRALTPCNKTHKHTNTHRFFGHDHTVLLQLGVRLLQRRQLPFVLFDERFAVAFKLLAFPVQCSGTGGGLLAEGVHLKKDKR